MEISDIAAVWMISSGCAASTIRRIPSSSVARRDGAGTASGPSSSMIRAPTKPRGPVTRIFIMTSPVDFSSVLSTFPITDLFSCHQQSIDDFRSLFAVAPEILMDDTAYLFFSISVIYFKISFVKVTFIIKRNLPYLLLYLGTALFLLKFHYFYTIFHYSSSFIHSVYSLY